LRVKRLRSVTLGIAVFLASAPAWGQHWPQFRGPDSNGLAADAGRPDEWGLEKNLAWKVRVPGRGWSSPIVWGEKVFVTTAVQEEAPNKSDRRVRGGIYRWEVHCLDLATGRTLWKRVAARGEPRITTHQDNTYASETPVTDGRRVYAYFGMTGLYAYDLDGNLSWKKDLGAHPMRRDWGTSSSPLIYDGTLFLQIDSEGDSFLAALDAETGGEIWRVARDEGSNWSSPIIWTNKERTELVTSGQRVRSYDPATGALFWELSIGGGRCSASPTGDEERLYVGSEEREGGGGILFAVKAGASGDITPEDGATTSAGVLWSREKAAPAMASPLAYRGLVYALKRRTGIVTAHDPKTGEETYKKRVEGAPGFWASPWASDGKIYCLDENGTTHVLRAGPEFEVLARNPIDEQSRATPAVTPGGLVLRGIEHLYRIRR
jgi:outer membrane protein assembly factor BamB